MNFTIQIFIILASIPAQFILGIFIFSQFIPLVARKLCLLSSDEEPRILSHLLTRGSLAFAIIYVVGLITHLALSFLIRCWIPSWWVALLIPLLPALFAWRTVAPVWQQRPKFTMSFNFFLWAVAHLLLATSLFSVSNEASTPWVNNYGDLTFHIGIIRSFIWGENFPPEMHLFPGVELGYPVLINYWTALWSWMTPALRSIKFVFVVQWLIIWLLVYVLLEGNKHRLLPWAILFAGGSYFTWNILDLGRDVELSWQRIGKGYPWAVFLTSIWVTQRSALLGLILILSSVRLFEILKVKDLSLAAFSAIGILAVGILSHVHFVLVALMFIAFFSISSFKGKGNFHFRLIIYLAIAALPLLAFIPFFDGKSGIAQYLWGWRVGEASAYELFLQAWGREAIEANKAGFESLSYGRVLVLASQHFFTGIFESSKMWMLNAWQVFTFALMLLFCRSLRLPLLVLAGIFVIGNFVSLSYWAWDQIKYFAAIYIILIALACSAKFESQRQKLFFKLCLVTLLIPGIWETIQVVITGKSSTPYNQSQIVTATNINEVTPPQAIIAGAPNHNTPITLAGRKIFLGYDGTIWTHGLRSEAQPRLAVLKELQDVISCKQRALLPLCPDYILWTDAERNYWKTKQLPLRYLLKATAVPYLFEIKSNS